MNNDSFIVAINKNMILMVLFFVLGGHGIYCLAFDTMAKYK